MEHLNNLEIVIRKILSDHLGRENAIGREGLVELINIDCPLFPVHEREVRATIKHLVTQHGEWIGSCARGYFVIETEEELRQACKYYHGYALSLLYVEAKLRKTSLAELLGQLSMEFSEKAGGVARPTKEEAHDLLLG